jgi:glycosyltransferase involved in cell wall biosynthesis
MLKTFNYRSKWFATEFYDNEYKKIYTKILIGLNIDLVHIQHLIRHTHDLPKVAKILGLPIILSFHDFYYICPSINLLNYNNQYCAGQCTVHEKQCKIPANIFNDLPILSEFKETWKMEMSRLIDSCSSFIAPTESTMDIYISIYPQLKNKNYKVIEHGRDFEKTHVNVELPSKNDPIKIIIPGIIKHHKGQDFIKQLKKIDLQNRIEFHFMGIINEDLKEFGIYHGRYNNEDFCEIVNKIKPSFIGIFSICPETYCHVLTESWSCGVPVLATKLGALEERIIKNGGGWFLEHESPLKAYDQIIQKADFPEDYLKVTNDISNIKIKSKKEMADEYEFIYLENLKRNKKLDNI